MPFKEKDVTFDYQGKVVQIQHPKFKEKPAQDNEIETRIKVVSEEPLAPGRVAVKKKKTVKVEDMLGTTGSSILPQDPKGDNMLETYGQRIESRLEEEEAEREREE